jgi:hypothetical protein
MLMLVGHEHWMILVGSLESMTEALGKEIDRQIGCEYP